jgi:hypothetical protein
MFALPVFLPLKIFQVVIFVAFIATRFLGVPVSDLDRDLPPPISADKLQLLVFGEALVAAKLLEYWLLSIDMRSGEIVRYETLNYDHLTGWLQTVQDLDPRSSYPGLMASGVFVDVKDKQRARQMILFVDRLFTDAPGLRWRWQAQVVMLSKYRLQDMSLAIKLARNLRERATDANIPAWARDMEFLLLQDIGEFDVATSIITSMLDSGTITDPDELRVLTMRLQEMHAEQDR